MQQNLFSSIISTPRACFEWIKPVRRHKFLFTYVPAVLILLLIPAAITLAAPDSTYLVNSDLDEPNSSLSSTTCSSTPSGVCTLRAAIMAANANPGPDTITLPADVYTLSLPNVGGINEDFSQTGDLDVRESLTINGAGSGTTIIQAGPDAGSGIDKVFSLNPVCTSNVTITMDGVTVRYGRNTQPTSASDNSYYGGGIDWCGAGNGTLNLTNSTVSDNSNVNGMGAGLSTRSASGYIGVINITNVAFQNNHTQGATGGESHGGGLYISGYQPAVTINNSQVLSNTTEASGAMGGGIYFSTSNGGSIRIHNTVIDGNSAGGYGGGVSIYVQYATTVVVIDQGSRITNNISGNVSGGSAGGGGVFLDGSILSSTQVALSKVTITGNSESPLSSTRQGGGGILIQLATVKIEYSRITNNTILSSNGGSGLYKNSDPGGVNAINNWWGCSMGPLTVPCNTAILASGSAGSLTTTPYFRLTMSGGTTSPAMNQVTTITASINRNSINQDYSSNNDVLRGLPVTWSAAGGNLSSQQGTIQTNGNATASYQATIIGAGRVAAVVDNDLDTGSSSNILPLTVNKANTTAAIVGQSKTTTITGETFTVTYTVTGAQGNSPVSPTGTVRVSDGTNFCVGTLPTTSCNLTLLNTGSSRTLNAIYNGDGNFNVSPQSPGVSHTVNKASMTTTITTDNPDPSNLNQAVTVYYTVTVNSPGSGTPTGSVTVSDGVDSCTGTLPATSCNITLKRSGVRTLTATYGGSGNYNASPASAGESHTVNAPDLIVSKTHTGDFSQGQNNAQYRVTVTNNGVGPTYGAAIVTDTVPSGLTFTAYSGTGWSCNLATAVCSNGTIVNPGLNYPLLTLTFNVAGNTSPEISNSVMVAGGGELLNSNNTASDPTNVIQMVSVRVMASPAGRSFTVGTTIYTTPQNYYWVQGSNHSISTTSPQAGTTGMRYVFNNWSDGETISHTIIAPTTPITYTASFDTQYQLTTSVSPAGSGTVTPANGTYFIAGTVVNLQANPNTNYVFKNWTGPVASPTSTLTTITMSAAQSVTAIFVTPDLTISKTHSGNFYQGQLDATYSIIVSNNGTLATYGTVTVIDTLPTGLAATEISGIGWDCTLATLTCTRSDPLAIGDSYPSIVLLVNVAGNAPANITNTAKVSGGGEANTSNDTANDATTVNQQPDLIITKTHVGNFTQGQVVGAQYTIIVRNSGSASTNGMVTVVDTLPPGLTATSIAGNSWICYPASMTCTRSDSLAPNANYPGINVVVTVANSAPPSVTNIATVSGGGEINTSNNTANDVTTIKQLGDLTVGKTHQGDFTQGQSGATYTITVSNIGTGPTSGTVTAADTLPTGLSATSISGSGWSCSLSSLTCTRSDALAAGASFPSIALMVNAATNALANVTNTASVSGGGEVITNNNTSNDPTTINPSPETSITGNPANPSSSDIASFSYTGQYGTGLLTFECQLDSSGFSACESPKVYSSLSQGAHIFNVRAVDFVGVRDSTPSGYTWTVDTIPPETTITGSPADPSSITSATFNFSGSDTGGTGVASQECQLDGGGYLACASPQSFSNLSQGSHTFQVRAIDQVGNIDPIPASYTWTVDTVAPDTNLVSHPSNPGNSSASFTFTGSDPGGTGVASFECRLDSSSYSTCSIPQSYSGLSQGSHTFYVRAVDAAGNRDATPAEYTWAIDTIAPETTITSHPTDSSINATFTFTGSDPGGTGIAGFDCQRDTGGFSSCTSPSSYMSLTVGPHTFDVRAIDLAGNMDSTPASFSWEVVPPKIVINPVSLPDASYLAAYNQQISANGGTAPYTFSIIDGSLPDGLTLASNGALIGAPTATEPFSFTVQAHDSSEGSGPYIGSRSYTLNVYIPDLEITQGLSPISVLPGGMVTITLSFQNTGTGIATGGVLTDIVPTELSSLSFQASPGLVVIDSSHTPPYVWQVQDLAPGEGGMITVTGTLAAGFPAGRVVHNTVAIASTPETVVDNNTSSASFTVLNGPPVLNPISNQTINELAQLNFLAAAQDGNGDPLTFSMESGAPTGASITAGGVFSWTPSEAQGPGVYPITVEVVDNALPQLSDSQVFTVTVNEIHADLSLVKTAPSDPVMSGAQMVYTMTVTNQGPLDASNVTISDPLPSGVSFLSASSECSLLNGAVLCSQGGLANGASWTATITVHVTRIIPGLVTNTASVSSNRVDPNPADNTASADIQVINNNYFVYLPLMMRR